MKFGTRGRYAVTAMLDLALNCCDEPCSLNCVAQRQGISVNYLEQLFFQLRRAGLIISLRGRNGGYRLSRPAEQISVEQIMQAVEGELEVTRCGGEGNCQGGEMCLTHSLWDYLGENIRTLLGSISLGQLMEQEQIRNIAVRQQFYFKAEQPVNLQQT